MTRYQRIAATISAISVLVVLLLIARNHRNDLPAQPAGVTQDGGEF